MPNYRRGVYDYVVDSSFQPFSMQELLTPFMMYKDSYEKQEAAYEELNKKAGDFAYLASTLPEGSEARAIYEGYANDLKEQALDFSHNGLSMSNKRALMNLKHRYSGEIGLLEKASAAMEEEKKLRRANKDTSMLYATDNLNIDDFLYGKNPNLYGISGNDLFTKGAALGKAASSRIYKAGDTGSVLGNYYRNWREARGVSQDSIVEFMQRPEVMAEIDKMLEANGVLGNLSGANLERARQQALSGLYTGIVYEENNKPYKDEGVLSASDKATDARTREGHALTAAMYGLKRDGKGGWVPDPNNKGPRTPGNKSGNGTKSSSKGGGSNRFTQLPKGVRITWDDDPDEKDANGNRIATYSSTDLDTSPSTETKHEGSSVTYDQLPQYAKDRVDAELGPEGNVDLHRYYFKPFTRGDWNDTEAVLEIIPYKTAIFNGEDSDFENDTDLEGGN